MKTIQVKRNVLQLIGSFSEGGSERQALQLARLLKENGRHNVHVACLDASGVLRGEAERMGFGEIPEFPLTSFYDRNAIRQLRRFGGFLREREIALVHTHDFYTLLHQRVRNDRRCASRHTSANR